MFQPILEWGVSLTLKRSLLKNDSEDSSNSAFVSRFSDSIDLFFFSYSPALQSLVSWSGNAKIVLGVDDLAVVRDANLFLRYVYAQDRFALMQPLEDALASKAPYRASYRWIRPDNDEVRWLHCRAQCTEEDGQILFEGVIIDLTDEVSDRLNTPVSAGSLSGLIAALPQTILILDPQLRVLRHKVAEEHKILLNPESSVCLLDLRTGRQLSKSINNQELSTALALAAEQILQRQQSSLKLNFTCAQRTFEIYLSALIQDEEVSNLLLMISDISTLEEARQKVLALNQTEALNLIASGLAHNLNNALQSILGNAAIISHNYNNPTLVQSASKNIADLAKRTADLTRQLTYFNNVNNTLLTPVDVNLSCMRAIQKTESLFGSGIKIAVIFGASAPVLAKNSDLIEALEALIMAIKKSPGQSSLITVSTNLVNLNADNVGGLSSGQYVEIKLACRRNLFLASANTTTAVPDSETGKTAGAIEEIGRLFKSYGGILLRESLSENSSCYKILLPVISDLDRQPETAEEFSAAEILIVDDDPFVSETVVSILNDRGYICLHASSGEQALKILRGSGRNIKVILLDGFMPGVSGANLVRRILKLNPGLQILVFSGAPEEVTRPMLGAGAIKVLSKPISTKDLLRHVTAARESFYLPKAL